MTGQKSVSSPMPCRISQVAVKTGDKVSQGQILLVVEAMKMELVIKAPMDGIVKRIYYKEGQLVAEKQHLIDLADSQ